MLKYLTCSISGCIEVWRGLVSTCSGTTSPNELRTWRASRSRQCPRCWCKQIPSSEINGDSFHTNFWEYWGGIKFTTTFKHGIQVMKRSMSRWESLSEALNYTNKNSYINLLCPINLSFTPKGQLVRTYFWFKPSAKFDAPYDEVLSRENDRSTVLLIYIVYLQ